MVKEPKPLAEGYRRQTKFRAKRGHKEWELDLKGTEGNQYRLIARQSIFNALDFSIILSYVPADSNQLFRLQRYNGKSHEHTNHIEEESFYDFHIHKATERYQELGSREDGYAELSDRFYDYPSALRCMLEDCGFSIPENPQQELFGEI